MILIRSQSFDSSFGLREQLVIWAPSFPQIQSRAAVASFQSVTILLTKLSQVVWCPESESVDLSHPCHQQEVSVGALDDIPAAKRLGESAGASQVQLRWNRSSLLWSVKVV